MSTLKTYIVDLGGDFGLCEITEHSGCGFISPPGVITSIDDSISQLKELFISTDDAYSKSIDFEIEQIEHELEWVEQGRASSPYPISDSPYYHLEDNPLYDEITNHIIKCPRIGWEIEQSLNDFEEDLEYEKWINSEDYIISLTEYNFHKLLSCYPDNRKGWLGKQDEPKLSFNSLPEDSSSHRPYTGSLLLKERYLCEVEIIKEYDSPSAFALGKTDFGIVYFPKKFFGYLTKGQILNVTIALQDIERTKNKKNIGPRFIAIYTHK